MVITILEGKVSKENIPVLHARFKDIAINDIKPAALVKTYLITDIRNEGVCRIITLWESMEGLQEMRKQGTPAGVLIFREAGVEPSLTIHEVLDQSF